MLIDVLKYGSEYVVIFPTVFPCLAVQVLNNLLLKFSLSTLFWDFHLAKAASFSGTSFGGSSGGGFSGGGSGGGGGGAW